MLTLREPRASDRVLSHPTRDSHGPRGKEPDLRLLTVAVPPTPRLSNPAIPGQERGHSEMEGTIHPGRNALGSRPLSISSSLERWGLQGLKGLLGDLRFCLLKRCALLDFPESAAPWDPEPAVGKTQRATPSCHQLITALSGFSLPPSPRRPGRGFAEPRWELGGPEGWYSAAHPPAGQT